MKAAQENFTPEEMELIRAYRRDYMRKYRQTHKEAERNRALRNTLRKAKAAVAAGKLDFPAQDPAAATATE